MSGLVNGNNMNLGNIGGRQNQGQQGQGQQGQGQQGQGQQGQGQGQQGQRQINIHHSQVAQLVQGLKNEVALAKASADDPAKQEQHYKKAESIKQILLNYQAQQKRLQQQQQMQQQQMQQQQMHGGQQQPQNRLNNPNGNMNNSVPNTGLQQQQSPQMQSYSQMPSSDQSPMPQNLGQQRSRQPSNHATPVMQSPSFGTNQLRQSPVLQQQQQPGMRPQTANPTGQVSNIGGAPSIPANAVTVDRFNQVKQRLVEVQRKIQMLEQTKNSGNVPVDKLQLLDKEIVQWRTKFQQYQKVGLIMKNQLMQQQAEANNTTTGNTGVATPTLNQQFIAQQNNIGSPALQQRPNTQPMGQAQQAQRLQQMQQQAQQKTQAQQLQQLQQQQQFQQLQQQQQQHQQQQQQQQAQMKRTQPVLTQPTEQLQQQVQQQLQQGIQQTMNRPTSVVPQLAQTSAPTSAPALSISPPSVAAATAAAAAQPATKQGTLETKSVTPTGEDSGKTDSPLKLLSQSLRSNEPPPLNLSGITKPSVPLIPISTSINVKPPTAVTLQLMGDTRATITGGAASSLGALLNSPAITKMPMLDLATSGASTLPENCSRVLTKRKLSELVSTAGVDEGDGKTSIDGNVEELLLDLADEFINSVTSFACRLAKHRKVDTIDTKDVQLHLERNWNIRIPGYAMDEIRLTRKLQPTASHNQKVSGVDISKSVNGNLS